MTEYKDERSAPYRTSRMQTFDHRQSPTDLLKTKINILINILDQKKELKNIKINVLSYLPEILEYVDKIDKPYFINPLAFILGRLGIQSNKLVTKNEFKILGNISSTISKDVVDYKVDVVDIIRYSRLWTTLLIQ